MRRPRSWWAGTGLALALSALCLVPAAPALASIAAPAANGSECAEEFAPDTTFFEPGPELLPPAFRGIPYDCATLAPTADLSAEGTAIYRLVYLDPGFDEYLDMVRSLEREGWVQGSSWQNIIYADGSTGASFEVTPDELAALDEPPELVQHGFVTANTDSDIQMSWSTGNLLFFEQPHIDVAITLGFRYSTTGLDDPSVLSTLRTIPEVAPTPAQWGVIGAGSLMLMLVVGWPSSLLNSVVGSRYDALVSRLRSRFRRPAAGAGAKDPDAAPTRSRIPGWLMWPGFALAAILGAFVDPAFGVNPMSLRVVITLFVSFVLLNLLSWTIVSRVARRIQPDSRPYLRFRWGSLAIVAIAVLAARLLEFQPGVIFGLVAGLAFAVTLKASGSALVVIAGSGFALALGLVAWVGYSLLAPVAASENLVLVFIVEFLSGLTIKGVSSLPLALLPLGGLDGAKLLRWKRWAWALAYAIGLAAFMLVLLTIPKAWGEIPGDFVRWLLIFGVYALVAIALWVVNTRALARAARREVPEPERGGRA